MIKDLICTKRRARTSSQIAEAPMAGNGYLFPPFGKNILGSSGIKFISAKWNTFHRNK